jgi:hypothetical protein
MSINTQTLNDDGQSTVVKAVNYYSGSDTSNNVIVVPKNLRYANTSQLCMMSIVAVQYNTSTANGIVQLYWESSSANTPIYTFGRVASGRFDAYIVNNAPNPTGNIGIQTINMNANDNFSFVISMNKDTGFANAFLLYDVAGQINP